ncbi:hypothetical protein SLA2020_150810 [Shorea laevis]
MVVLDYLQHIIHNNGLSGFFSFCCFSVVFSFFICPSHGVTQDVLATICSQTQNQEYSIGLLQSDPRTSSADIPLLSLTSLELAIHQADENYHTFVQYKKNSTRKALSGSFGNCVTIYQDMRDKLQADHQLSQQRQFEKITNLGGLTTLAYNCDNGLPFSPPTASITEDMLLTLQTAIYVNEYVQSTPESNV